MAYPVHRDRLWLSLRVPRDPLKVMEQDMGNLIEASCPNIVHERVHVTKKRLAGKIIHVVGPRKLENDLLVSFIRKETDADCCLTDFDGLERYIGNATPEPFRLFLIDYREPRLSGVLKQAAYNGDGSPLARYLITMYNSGKSKNSTDRKRRARSCGILYGCDSATALLDRICSLFSDGDTPENGSAECEEAIGKAASSCPLTWRELQLLMLLTEGLQNREIGSRIGISSHTVRTHLYNSFAKIDARNRLEATAWIESHISMLYLLL
jgi:DNA-binding NarL/FixJ family response regulator